MSQKRKSWKSREDWHKVSLRVFLNDSPAENSMVQHCITQCSLAEHCIASPTIAEQLNTVKPYEAQFRAAHDSVA